jgi:hypothetical protein
MTGLSLRELDAELVAELPARRALSVLTSGSGSSQVDQSDNNQGVQQGAATTNTVTQTALSVFGDASNSSSIRTANSFSAHNMPINISPSENN